MSTFQQQSRQRKIIYGVLILGLFTATLVYRNAVLAGQFPGATFKAGGFCLARVGLFFGSSGLDGTL